MSIEQISTKGEEQNQQDQENQENQEEQEDIKQEERERETEDTPENVESLMKTGYFESEEEAEKFMEQLGKSLGITKEGIALSEKFESRIENIVQEALAQIEAIKKIAGGQLADESEVFKKEMMAIVEGHEDLESSVDDKNLFLLNLPKKLGKFVRDNKKAFMIFGALSAISRLGAGEAEASEVDNMEMMNYAGSHDASSNEIIENIETGEVEEESFESFEETIDQTPGSNYEQLVKNIESYKDSPDGIYFSQTNERDTEEPGAFDQIKSFFDSGYDPNSNFEEERGEDFNGKINVLIKSSKESLQTVKVMSYDQSIGVRSMESSQGDSESDYVFATKTAVEKVDAKTLDPGEGENFSGIGDDPESAFLNALKEAAAHKRVDVSASNSSYNYSENGQVRGFKSLRSEAGITENVTFGDVEITEETSENGEHKYYEAKIKSY